MTESGERDNYLLKMTIENLCCILTEAMGCAMIVTDRNNGIIYANPSSERLFGYSQKGLAGVEITSLVPEYNENLIKPLPANYTLNDIILTGIRKDGSKVSLETKIRKIIWEDNPVYIIMFHNISEFRTLESEFTTIFEAVPAMIFLSDEENKIVKINTKGARLLGMQPEDIIGKNIIDLLYPGNAEKFIQDSQDILENGERKFEILETKQTLTDETRWLQTYKVPYRNQFGKIAGIAGFIIDITRLKQTEEALREAESKYRFVVENSMVGVYVLLGDGHFAYVNPRFAEIFGYTEDEIVETRTVLELVAPECRKMIKRNFKERISGEIPKIRYSFKGLRKDGNIIDIEVLSTSTIYNGAPAIIGSMIDITERVESQRRRKEMEAHKREFYRRTILAATEGKLVITDPHEIKELSGEILGEWQICSGEDMSAIRNSISRIAIAEGMNADRTYDFVLSIGEAITNVVKHAGSGEISLHRQKDGLIAVISDKGSGIDALELPDLALTRGYTTAISLGMGYKAMISLADTVYLATGTYGTIVAICMKYHPDKKPVFPGLGIYHSI